MVVYVFYVSSCFSYASVAIALVLDLQGAFRYNNLPLIPGVELAVTLLFANTICSLHADVFHFRPLRSFPLALRSSRFLERFWLYVDRTFAVLTATAFALNAFILPMNDTMFLIGSAIISLGFSYQGRCCRRKGEIIEYMVLHTFWHLHLPAAFYTWLLRRGKTLG